MGAFKYPFNSRILGVSDQLLTALASNFRQAATEAWVTAAVDAASPAPSETGIIIPEAVSLQTALRKIEAYVQNLEETFEQHHHDERYGVFRATATESLATTSTTPISAGLRISDMPAGWYEVDATISFESSAVTNGIGIYLYSNSSPIAKGWLVEVGSSATPATTAITQAAGQNMGAAQLMLNSAFAAANSLNIATIKGMVYNTGTTNLDVYFATETVTTTTITVRGRTLTARKL